MIIFLQENTIIRAFCKLLVILSRPQCVNTLRPRQNGRHFADDIVKCIFSNENVWVPIKISLKFVRKGPINNIPALVQIMAWRRPGDKPLSEPVMVRLPTHICVTRPRWVNAIEKQIQCVSNVAISLHIQASIYIWHRQTYVYIHAHVVYEIKTCCCGLTQWGRVRMS